MYRIVSAAVMAMLVAACASSDNTPMQQSSAPPGGPSVITGSGSSAGAGAGYGSSAMAPAVAGPQGCSGPISEYQQIVDRDVETGYLNPGVYNRILSDLAPAKEACAGNREADANTRLAAVKRQYGYR